MSAWLIEKHALYDYMQIRLEAELIIRLQMRPPNIKRCLLSTSFLILKLIVQYISSSLVKFKNVKSISNLD